MRDISNSERLLKIIDIFTRKTDETHGLSIGDLHDLLKAEFGNDFNVNRKSIKNDIDTLTVSGFHIIETNGLKNKKFYSYQNRKFELHELRMLIDAICSARFITKKETQRLIQKIRTLTSENLSSKLQNQIYLDDRIKADNENVRYFIDQIHNAIDDRKKITFKYGRYNVKKEFLLSRKGLIYSVAPYGLVWNQDFYYLIGKLDDFEGIKHYRVDRMSQVTMKDETFIRENFNIADYVNKTFNMYTGVVEPIEIQFKNQLVNVVIDRFGKDVDLRRVDDDSFKIRFQAAVSEGLVRWILTWGSDAKVISPENLIQELKIESQKMVDLYL